MNYGVFMGEPPNPARRFRKASQIREVREVCLAVMTNEFQAGETAYAKV